jgi:hypothetical protein
MTILNGYHSLINQATGLSRKEDLDKVEEIMRHGIYHSRLDWQSRSELWRGAKMAHKMMKKLRKASEAKKTPARKRKAVSR